VNPSARLPFSVPTDSEHLPPFDLNADKFVYDRWHGWWHLEKESHVPAYPFGFGLSYTTFELGPIDCDVSADSEVSAGTVDIQGSVANTGLRDGADVVQVYVKLPDPDAPRRLVGFVRVEVAAGESEEFSLRIPLGRMAFRDLSAHSWKAPAGNHVNEDARFAGDPDARSVTIEL
jgi:beta-glucosidase